MNKRTRRLAVLIMTLLVGGTLVWAQQQAKLAGSDQQPMLQMMNGEKQHSGMHAAVEKLEKAIAEARQSNDPAQMKAALDQVHAQLTEWKQGMSMCPMAGGSGMMNHSSMHGTTMNQSGQGMNMKDMSSNNDQPKAR